MSNQKQRDPTPIEKFEIVGLFIRGLSFENFMLQRNEPVSEPAEYQIEINTDKGKADGDVYEVVIRLQITANEKTTERPLFLLDLEYSGLFNLAEVDEEHYNPLLSGQCPQILYPFVVRIVHDLTRDGGFPPMPLRMIDFEAMYLDAVEKQSGSS